MEDSGLIELTTLRTVINKASLAEEARRTSLWCLDQLPPLYADFRRTYESRFGDSIFRLAQAILKRLAEKGTGDDAGRVGAVLVAELGSLHERLGLPALGLKVVVVAAPARARARAKKVAS